MSAIAAKQGIQARLKTIDGLSVLTYEPTTVQRTPLAFVFLASATNHPRGLPTSATLARRDDWRFGVRVLVAFQDNRIAEDTIAEFADSIPAALYGDPTLGGKGNLLSDIDQSAEGPDGYYQIADTLFRSLVLRFTITDKA